MKLTHATASARFALSWPITYSSRYSEICIYTYSAKHSFRITDNIKHTLRGLEASLTSKGSDTLCSLLEVLFLDVRRLLREEDTEPAPSARKTEAQDISRRWLKTSCLSMLGDMVIRWVVVMMMKLLVYF